MKKFKKVLALLLALSMFFCFCACDGNGDDSTTTTESTTNENSIESTSQQNAGFTVKVVDEGGNAVSGVMVQVCKDACVPARTDDKGVATFSIEITDGYKLSVMTCPEGYEYTGDAEIYLESGITEYTLTVKAVA